MKYKYCQLNTLNETENGRLFSYYSSSFLSSTTFFTQLFSVDSNLSEILKPIAIQASSVDLSFSLNAFNNSVEWLNQLILNCVSVFVLRGGY